MILNRLGNKSRIASDIIQHFPQHRTFIDMFFGAGGIFFNKPLADYNFCNDIDDDVFNLYMILQSNKDKFIKEFELMPMHESLLKYWNKNIETDPIKKALRFLCLSNYSLLGSMTSMRFTTKRGCVKTSKIDAIENTFAHLKSVQMMCCDFRKVLSKIQFRNDLHESFIYADPPYLGTNDNYSQSFKEQDTIDLFNVLVNSKIRFALSEFDNPFVLELAKQHNLEVITIGERQNMKNRRTEILVVNYESPALYSLFRNQDLAIRI